MAVQAPLSFGGGAPAKWHIVPKIKSAQADQLGSAPTTTSPNSKDGSGAGPVAMKLIIPKIVRRAACGRAVAGGFDGAGCSIFLVTAARRA